MSDSITICLISTAVCVCGIAITLAAIYAIMHLIRTLRQTKIYTLTSDMSSGQKIMKKRAFPKALISSICIYATISLIEILAIFFPNGIDNLDGVESVFAVSGYVAIFMFTLSGIIMLVLAYRESVNNCVISRSKLPKKYNFKFSIFIRILYCLLLIGIILAVMYLTYMIVGLQWIFVILYLV